MLTVFISEKSYRVPENNREVFEVLHDSDVIDDHTLIDSLFKSAKS